MGFSAALMSKIATFSASNRFNKASEGIQIHSERAPFLQGKNANRKA